MHKTDLVTAVAERTGLHKNKADAVVSAFIEQITNALCRAESVNLVGFGSFNHTRRAARHGRNPGTGAALDIPSRNAVTFRAGSALKAAVNRAAAE